MMSQQPKLFLDKKHEFLIDVEAEIFDSLNELIDKEEVITKYRDVILSINNSLKDKMGVLINKQLELSEQLSPDLKSKFKENLSEISKLMTETFKLCNSVNHDKPKLKIEPELLKLLSKRNEC